MKLRNPSNGVTLEEPPNPKNDEMQTFSDDVDSNCSTPYVSAPSSPGRIGPLSAASCYYFSAPASPVHYILSSSASAAKPSPPSPELLHSGGGSFEFGGAGHSGPMISADELFLNGQIRPMKLSSHLQRPQALAPLMDLDEGDEQGGENGGRGREVRLRSRSIHRRARSMSPLRTRCQWEVGVGGEDEELKEHEADADLDPKPEDTVAASGSASSSRSSSSGRNSKRWIFLKDLLYRSKSEGRAREKEKEKEKEKFWHFSPKTPQKKRGNPNPSPSSNLNPSGVSNGVGSRRAASAHERHYTANRAQTEEMRRRTFLPYRQGLLGCLGFSSRGYGAVNGFARTLNPVSSR